MRDAQGGGIGPACEHVNELLAGYGNARCSRRRDRPRLRTCERIDSRLRKCEMLRAAGSAPPARRGNWAASSNANFRSAQWGGHNKNQKILFFRDHGKDSGKSSLEVFLVTTPLGRKVLETFFLMRPNSPPDRRADPPPRASRFSQPAKLSICSHCAPD